MDRFREPDEPRVITHCAYCVNEIYEGDAVYKFKDGEHVHDHCFSDYVEDSYVQIQGVMASDGGID